MNQYMMLDKTDKTPSSSAYVTYIPRILYDLLTYIVSAAKLSTATQ